MTAAIALAKAKSASRRVAHCAREALPKSAKVSLWLVKLTLPISLIVRLMQYYGVLAWMAGYLNPIFNEIGLPGESAMVFITGALLPPYAAVAVMTTLTLTLRQATILSLMVLICHALPMECAVTHKTGSSFWGMVALRISMAFGAAFYLNWVLPQSETPFGILTQPETYDDLGQLLWAWLSTGAVLAITIIVIVYVLMVLNRVLEEFHLLGLISKPLEPLMRLFGLPRKAAYLWLVGNLLGISYGSAVMVDMLDNGKYTSDEADEVNHHLAMNHSLLEDTTVFATLGIGVFWIVSTRLLFALVVVWGRKLLKYKKSQ